MSHHRGAAMLGFRLYMRLAWLRINGVMQLGPQESFTLLCSIEISSYSYANV